MRALIIAALMMAVASASTVSASSNYEEMFAQFKTRYNKKYATPEEETRRFALFTANMNRAAEQNRQNPLASFGANQFADLSRDEFTRRKGLKMPPGGSAERSDSITSNAVPADSKPECSYVDWRLQGVVTPVKNQGECGGCWSFSSTGVIESQWALAGHPLTSLSEQELLACGLVGEMDLGCDGGWVDTIMHYLLTKTNGTIVTSASYPFASIYGFSPECDSNFHKFEVGATIIGWSDIPTNEPAMAAFLCKKGPFSILVDAIDVELYTGGIMTTCSRETVDHAILMVGMDLAYSTPYWIIKNSWGADWGEDGYFRVAYGENLCDVTFKPLTVLV